MNFERRFVTQRGSPEMLRIIQEALRPPLAAVSLPEVNALGEGQDQDQIGDRAAAQTAHGSDAGYVNLAD